MLAAHREMGDAFELVYARLIFDRTPPVAEAVLRARPDALVGGTGSTLVRSLEGIGICTTMHDYSIYPGYHPQWTRENRPVVIG